MEPEILPPSPNLHLTTKAAETVVDPAPAAIPPPAVVRDLNWVLLGDQGLRAGWSIFLFLFFTIIFVIALGGLITVAATQLFHLKENGFTPGAVILDRTIAVCSILGAAFLLARIEHRRLGDFYLSGPSRLPHFLSGLAAGFATLSVLVGVMAAGGWLHFGSMTLAGGAIFRYAALWGVAFLLVGCFEEGIFRCYLQFTLARGINFWWALGVNGLACLFLFVQTLRLHPQGSGFWGVFAAALLGLIPCFLLYFEQRPSAGFWNAAWVTSTFFGLIHTGNNGENWIGIFAAAAIGFVFCVSIRLTGSAWWAIGCHAAWDWAETYFYGTADSGLVPVGHFLSSTANGNPLWSGGTDGPEGSLLVLPVILLMLFLLLALYGRRAAETPTPRNS
jgi:membrane protease YdiL (CAAX protease family)